jgi:hypothetical protein
MNEAKNRTIKITVGNRILTATMYNNPAADDFLSLLPLSLTLSDYAGTEKISDLPKKLAAKDLPAGYKPSPGDITYYAPWGNLALFYKSYDYSGGLVSLGKLNSGIEVFKVQGSVYAIIEPEN